MGKLVYSAVAVLLPLNLAVLSLLKERGITTAYGICRIAIILAQPLAVAAICQPQLHSTSTPYSHCFAIAVCLDYSIFNAAFLRQLPLPQPALIAAAFAFLVAGYGCLRRKGAIENGLFWALPAACLALAFQQPVSTFYFSTAGLILVISVIEASHVMAFRDELTGLPARRALNEFLLKLGSRYTVAMLDIDFFKKFNDTYGHDIGDQVLRMVASKISQVTGGGRAFRYGGEEFTVIYSGKSAEEAIPHLDQLRMAIESAGFVVRAQRRPRKKPDKIKVSKASQKKVKLTISIGVAERNGKRASPQDVIKAADKALYRAKKAGRNRVSI
jgi:GGDEF domain-containing protein